VTKPQDVSKTKSFSVPPSPFNSIKLELAIILIVGGLLILAMDSITQDLVLQITLLFVAGLSGMVWLGWRTRKVLNHHAKEPTPERESGDGGR
jgi:hypothetical protein